MINNSRSSNLKLSALLFSKGPENTGEFQEKRPYNVATFQVYAIWLLIADPI